MAASKPCALAHFAWGCMKFGYMGCAWDCKTCALAHLVLLTITLRVQGVAGVGVVNAVEIVHAFPDPVALEGFKCGASLPVHAACACSACSPAWGVLRPLLSPMLDLAPLRALSHAAPHAKLSCLLR